MWELADAPQAQGALFEQPVFEREPGRGEFRGMEFLHVRARTIINEIKGDVPYLPFRYTINPYRGCSHACGYCFARPTHAYLDLDIGRDFETRIVVKVNAVERLRVELDPRRWRGEHIAMGTNTDPYQRCEGKYRLTRGIVEVLNGARNPFSILTKSTLILRDLDVLVEAAQRDHVRVNLSIGALDEDVWRATEPGTPHPRQRVEAVRKLNAAGVPTGVLVAPILPGLSDAPGQIDDVVGACLDAGATSVSSVLLHLRPGVKGHWLTALDAIDPQLAQRHRQLYGERSYAAAAERRRVGAVVQAAIRRHGGSGRDVRFEDQARVDTSAAAVAPPARRRAAPAGQMSLL